MTCSRQELRKVRFVDADQRMETLAALPEIIRYSPSEEELEQRVVRVLLEGIVAAQVAAIVTCLSDDAAEPKVSVRTRNGETAAPATSRRVVGWSSMRCKTVVRACCTSGSRLFRDWKIHVSASWIRK